jgi:hypothetical protein
MIIAAFCYLLFLRGKGAVITTAGGDGPFTFVAMYRHIFLWIIAGSAAVLCLLLLFTTTRNFLKKIWSKILVHGLKLIKKFKNAIVIYCCKPLAILSVFGLTIFVQLTVITGYWFLGKSMGIAAGLKYYYVFFTLAWVTSAVPVSIGGAVVAESFLAYMFVKFAGVPAPAALAIALCQRIIWMIASLPGGAIHMFGAHLPKDFSVDYGRAID